MNRTEWNPRVLQWARLHGIEEELVKRGATGEVYYVDGAPWTVAYSGWTKRRWRDFHMQCHGTPERGECCAGGPETQQRFTEWLDNYIETAGKS